jgi:thioredoxin 1
MFSGNSAGIAHPLVNLRRAALAFPLRPPPGQSGSGFSRVMHYYHTALTRGVLASRRAVMVKWLVIFAVAFGSLAAVGAPLPYDEHADARVTLQQGLDAARASGKQVLVVFGANWCKDCRELDKALHGRAASLIDARFVVVKIDVGNFDKNLDVVKRYGYPIGKGIPAAVVLNANGKVLYATRAGELADARHMGDDGIYDFFAKVVPARQ